ncbi:MAG: PAS domain S-box protein [Chitinivibrionales bacterium]|nr:PAS domain S-box protein [Chitinivibrionales bacterium]
MFSSILDNTPVLIALIDHSFNFMYVNPAFARETGRTASSFIGKNYFEFYPDEKKKSLFQKTVKTGIPFYFQAKPFSEKENSSKEAESYWDWSLVPVKDQGGNVSRIVLTLYNVTEKLAAEHELLQSEEKYRSLFEAGSDAIICVDVQTLKIQDVNQAAIGLYGYTRAEMLNLSAPDLSAEKSRTKRSLKNFAQSLETKTDKKSHIALRYHKKKNGTVFPVEITARHFCLDGKKFNISSIRDITARVKAKEALQQKNIALNELIARIEIEKKRIKEEFAATIAEVITPVLERMRADVSTERYAALLESSLKTVSSAYGLNIARKSPQLTQKEIEICTMVRNGLSSKEIAHILNRSIQTIEKRRKIIRKKLGLEEKSINLATFLKTYDRQSF